MIAPTQDAPAVDALAEVTWLELQRASGLTEAELAELVSYGALTPRDPAAATWTFEARWMVVARHAARLSREYELDPYGVSVVLSYCERIERLQAEVRALRARLG